MDTKITERFIKEYPHFDKCLIQVFDDVEDRKDAKLARGAMRWSDQTKTELETLNAQGAGIFFSVNPIVGDKRIQTAVEGVNARICEIDHLTKEEQYKLIEMSPLRPSMIVESKRSYHIYRFAKDGKLENWRKICRGVRNFFGGDHKIITEERVLRLPGFNHCKTLDDTFETTYRPMGGKKYTEEQMIQAFPDTTNKLEQQKELKKIEYDFSKDDDFRGRAKSVNAEYMLGLLDGTKRVNGEKIEIRNKQIFVNEKSTSSWIDEQGMIGSHDNGGPLWTNWISRYGTVDRKELYKRTIEKLPELKKDTIKKPKQKEVKKEISSDDFLVEYDRGFQIDIKSIVPFTWGSEKLDSYFGRFERGRFMTTIGESGSGKTTRAFAQAIEISKSYKVLFISLEMVAQRVIELRARKMSGITNEERNDKTMNEGKIQRMEKIKNEITENRNLAIVGVNRKADLVHIDLVLDAIKQKYMDYDWIVIDNLGFIRGDGDDLYKELNGIVRKIKDFCHNENKNINLLHHFNKGKSGQSRRDRTFADVLGTGKLEHDVDYGVFITRYLDDRENLTGEEQQQVFVRTAKNRDTGEVKKGILYFHKGRYYDQYQG